MNTRFRGFFSKDTRRNVTFFKFYELNLKSGSKIMINERYMKARSKR